MNKKFVYQVRNNNKVIFWRTANQISKFASIYVFRLVCEIKFHIHLDNLFP